MNDIEILKHCKVCKETKLIELFSKQSSAPDGYKYECKKCAADRNKRLYQNKTPEQRRAYQEDVVGWQKENPEKFNAAQERYRKSKKVNE